MIRNQSDGYLILNAKIITSGNLQSQAVGAYLKIFETGLILSWIQNSDLIPQSLLNQEAQKEIVNILGNAQSFLDEQGSSLTQDELDYVRTK